jgi:7-keto-8-aminopelargonate synthetase-like enzyme
MLAILDGKPDTYKAWAQDYYETPVSLSAVQQIYGHVPLTRELLQELNATTKFESVLADAAEIDYPVACSA